MILFDLLSEFLPGLVGMGLADPGARSLLIDEEVGRMRLLAVPSSLLVMLTIETRRRTGEKDGEIEVGAWPGDESWRRGRREGVPPKLCRILDAEYGEVYEDGL